jgi:hypothetical protein
VRPEWGERATDGGSSTIEWWPCVILTLYCTSHGSSALAAFSDQHWKVQRGHRSSLQIMASTSASFVSGRTKSAPNAAAFAYITASASVLRARATPHPLSTPEAAGTLRQALKNS